MGGRVLTKVTLVTVLALKAIIRACTVCAGGLLNRTVFIGWIPSNLFYGSVFIWVVLDGIIPAVICALLML